MMAKRVTQRQGSDSDTHLAHRAALASFRMRASCSRP